ncbi:MAG: hypothetical protein P8R42_20605 [Candidatus Binatia bacterium]|nr:hypothetical protein [Candidatus Binatia bacterium]
MVRLRGVIVALVAAVLAVAPANARTGLLDREFGRQGLVRTDLGGGPDAAAAVVVQPDGRIVVAGHAAGPAGVDVALVRHLPTGGLDPSFGAGGKVLADFSGHDEASALGYGPAGTLVVAGSTVGPAGRRRLLLARFGGDGALDVAFGNRGLVVLSGDDAGARARGLVVLPDSSVLVAGSAGRGARERFLLARFSPTGRLDSSFGDGGVVRPDLDGESGGAFAIAVQDGGAIVVAGRLGKDLGALRFGPDGTLDDDFGDGGVVRVDVESGHDIARAIALQPDGRILLAGTSARLAGADFVLARLDAEGNLDRTFAQTGVRRTDLGGIESGHAVALLVDGRIIVAGHVLTDEGSDLALAAHLADGTLDRSFGDGGRVRTDLQSRGDGALALALQSDGRLLAAGIRGEGATMEMALVRYRDGDPECGDGFVEGAETCDAGDDNGAPSSCCTGQCRYRAAEEICRSSEGLCDPAETCSGSSAVCPVDEIAPAERECREAAGWCDLAEECSGTSKQCPDDGVRDRDAVCRSAIGPCDAAESCDGETRQCPTDQKSTGICRPAKGDCDLAETCSGTSDHCPVDVLEANGNSCYDRNPCTVDEVCLEGACGSGTFEPFLCGAMLCGSRTVEKIESNGANEDRQRYLEDGLEDGHFVLKLRKTPKTYFCARASLTGEAWNEEPDYVGSSPDPSGLLAPAKYRMSFRVAPTGPPALKRLILRDRFGRRPVSVSEKRKLSIPVTTGDRVAAQALSPDRRKCYVVAPTRSVGFRRLPVWLDEEPLLFDLRSLKEICVPVSVNGEPSVASTAVACYAATRSRGEEPLKPVPPVEVETSSGYRWTLTAGTREWVCVPADVEPTRSFAQAARD